MITVLLLKVFKKALNVHYSHGLGTAVAQLSAIEYAPKLVLVIPVSAAAQGRASSRFLAIICNTLAFISEPFGGLTAPHLCHHRITSTAQNLNCLHTIW